MPASPSALLIAGGYVMEHGTVTKREQELAAVQAQIAAVPRPAPAKRVTISPELATEKDARQTAVDQALSGRTSWDTVLREVSLVLPNDVWLQHAEREVRRSVDGPVDPVVRRAR